MKTVPRLGWLSQPQKIIAKELIFAEHTSNTCATKRTIYMAIKSKQKNREK